MAMTMNKDEEIREGLRNSGIPEAVFSTTLVKEGAPQLRALVTDQTLVRPASARGLFLSPKKPTDAGKARKLFYLVAKELFLSGVSVYCVPLVRLMETLKSDDMDSEAFRIDRVRMVFVLEFYEDGAGFPFSTGDAARLRSWVRFRYEAGSPISFLSDKPLAQCTGWWPQSFLGFIDDNAIAETI